MTTRPLLILCIIIFLPLFTIAQPSIDNLVWNLKTAPFSGIISGKTYSTKIIQVPKELKCNEAKHNYLWYKNKLVVQIDGSGFLYEYNPGKPLKRMDSTCNEGYNFGAFVFVYKDTIYSMGGYGFWQFNGMVRYFNEKISEWEVVKTNKSIPLMQLMYSKPFYDIPNHKIYLVYVKPKPLNEDETYNIDKTLYVQSFDLIKKKWWEEPKLLNSKIKSDGILGFIGPGTFHSKFGLILLNETEVFIYDFHHNKLFTFLKGKESQIRERCTTRNERFFYTRDSSLYFFDPKSGLIDSISFGEHDFVDSGMPIYNNINTAEILITNPYPFIIILIALLSTISLIILFLKNKKLKYRNEFLMNNYFLNGKKGNGEVSVANPVSFRENLTEVEKGLLDILVVNTSIDTMTTVTQVNQVLGITNKPLKIQNNIRAATIQLINKKFMMYSGTADELIEKQRTEFDKRFFEYSIQRKYLGKVK
ncbi:MAG: hypothetical protein WCH78_07120 [Bacteroidota bacterium]